MEGMGMMDMYSLLMGGGSGGGGGSDIVVVHDVDGTLDKTWQELHDAMAAGKVVVCPYEDGPSYVQSMYLTYANIDDGCVVQFMASEGGDTVSIFTYFADTPNDYPMAN